MVFADRADAGRRPAAKRLPLDGRVAVVVADGIATGSTAPAACQIARRHGAARVVLAVPVAPPGWEAGASRTFSLSSASSRRTGAR